MTDILNGSCDELQWALSQLAEARIRLAQGIVDTVPLDDPASLISAIEHREAMREAAKAESTGWERKAA